MSLALLLTAIVLSAGLCAQEKGSAPSASTGKGAVPTITTGKNDLYDIDASGTDIKLVLEMLARRSGANIVVSPDVSGDVNVHLTQMPIKSILDYLSTTAGLSLQQTGSTYLVAGKGGLAKTAETEDKAVVAPTEPETLIWRCQYMKAAGLIALLGKLYPELKAAEGPGTTQPKLSDTQGGATQGTGGSGSSGSTGSSSSSSTSNDAVTSVVVIGDPKDVGKAKDLLAKLDVRPAQVSIDVAITELNSTFSHDLGVDWTWSDLSVSESSPTGIGFGKFSKSGMSFTGTIAALIKDGKGKLLAQPNLSVMDGADAEILIGSRLLFPKLTGYNSLGSPIYDKDEEKVGVSLEVSVKITDKDEVTMTVYPQVSLVTSWLTTSAGKYPQISTREAKTTVSIKNGATLAIGGLLQDDTIKQSADVPLLGKLPIIGGMFRHGTTTKDHTELVIFLTPKIVR